MQEKLQSSEAGRRYLLGRIHKSNAIHCIEITQTMSKPSNNRSEHITAVSSIPTKTKEMAFDLARIEGFNKGIEESQNAIEIHLNEITQKFERFMDQIDPRMNRLVKDWEEGLLQLSVDIAEKILLVELDRSDEYFIKMVHNALESFENESRVLIKVSEEDFERFFDEDQFDFETKNGLVHARVDVDPCSDNNGCIIETEHGELDIGVHSQLKEICNVLKKGS